MLKALKHFLSARREGSPDRAASCARTFAQVRIGPARQIFPPSALLAPHTFIRSTELDKNFFMLDEILVISGVLGLLLRFTFDSNKRPKIRQS